MGSEYLNNAKLTLKAGTTAAGTAPIKFTSGSLNTSPEVGAVEFLTDKLHLTITTGTTRKELVLADAALTSGRVPFMTTNGRLTDSASLTFNGVMLTAAQLAGSNIASGQVPIATTGGALYGSTDLTWLGSTLTATNLAGAGAGITSLSGSNISSGTVAVARLDTASFPKRWFGQALEATVVTGSAYTVDSASTSNAAAFGYTIYQTSSPAVGDKLSWGVELAAGTYTLTVLGAKNNNTGIYKWAMDGSDFLTGQDWYRQAGVLYNQQQTGSVTIATSGYHTLTCECTGKHVQVASEGNSSNYYYTFQAVWLKPTAD